MSERPATGEHPDFALETKVVRSYIRLDRAVYNPARAMASYDMSMIEAQERMLEIPGELKSPGEKMSWL